MRADESEDNFIQSIGKLGHGIGLGADRAVGRVQSGGTAAHAAAVATGTQPPGSLSAELLNAAVAKTTSDRRFHQYAPLLCKPLRGWRHRERHTY